MVKYIVIAFTLLTGISSAQVTQEIKTNPDDPFIASLYDSLIGSNLKIYTGKKFYDLLSKKQVEGNLYYRDNDWTTGTLGYEGQVYSHVTMRYHTFHDRLTILKPGGYEAIEVPENKIDFFILHNTKFIKLLEPREGYYAVLYNGNIGIFARHYTSRHEKNLLITELKDRQKYYIKKDNTITQVKSKGSVMKVLVEQRAELRKVLRQRKIMFSQNREFALQLLGEEFDRLQKLK
ncbi:MAG: hypothetical protein KIT62_00275 [Cyclobacteriaceae bacterium]|nr:hypothetical protein [Cyclobacteriaceae bacterium]